MSEEHPPIRLTHSQFLVGAGVVEGSLLLTAFFLGWMMGYSPTQNLSWNWQDFSRGLLAAVPMLLILTALLLVPSSGIRQIREFVRDTLGPLLARCSVPDLVLLAVLAGVCEEVLFRGFLFSYIWRFNHTLAVIVSNLAFGLAHLVTPMYAFLAAMAGLYLTALLAVDPSPNLLIPITAHAVYDLAAFVFIVRDYHRHVQQKTTPTQ